MASERRTVPGPRPAVLHRRQVQQHDEPGAALDQGADRRAAQADDEIALPMSGHRPVLSLGRALANQDLLADEPLPSASGAGSGDAQRPPGPQAGRQLAAQRAAALHVQGLVDRLVRDPHRRIIGEIEPQAASDLLRAQRLPPTAIAAPAVTPTDPADLWAGDRAPVRPLDLAGEPVLDVASQLLVGNELRDLRTPCTSLGVPLRSRRSILTTTAARGGIAAQL